MSYIVMVSPQGEWIETRMLMVDARHCMNGLPPKGSGLKQLIDAIDDFPQKQWSPRKGSGLKLNVFFSASRSPHFRMVSPRGEWIETWVR